MRPTQTELIAMKLSRPEMFSMPVASELIDRFLSERKNHATFYDYLRDPDDGNEDRVTGEYYNEQRYFKLFFISAYAYGYGDPIAKFRVVLAGYSSIYGYDLVMESDKLTGPEAKMFADDLLDNGIIFENITTGRSPNTKFRLLEISET